MQLRWTQEASDDLERIAKYLFEHAPEHAERIVRVLFDTPSHLLKFPYRGRPGQKEGTRELVVSSLPYVVVYAVSEDVIHVVRILHGAQKWP